MTIKINRLSVEKDGATEVLRGGLGRTINSFKKLSGTIKVELSEGAITGLSEVSVESVSEELQDELYKVLDKIENELNGVSNDESDESDESTSFIVNFIDLTMKELGLSSEEVKQGKRDTSIKYKWDLASDDKSAVSVIINNQYELIKKAQDKTEEEEKLISELVDTLTSKIITEKFKEALKSINSEIEKHTELRSNLPVQSNEYRNSLEEEIKAREE